MVGAQKTREAFASSTATTPALVPTASSAGAGAPSASTSTPTPAPAALLVRSTSGAATRTCESPLGAANGSFWCGPASVEPAHRRRCASAEEQACDALMSCSR